MPHILLVSERYPQIRGWADADDVTVLAENQVPSRPELAEYDVVFVLGAITNPERGRQLGGVINLALPRGLIVILAYETAIESGMETAIANLTDVHHGRLAGLTDVVDSDPAFAEYFAVFGRSTEFFGEIGDGEVIGTVLVNDNPRPTAVAVQRGAGVVYVVPFFFAGAHEDFVRALFAAVDAHRESSAIGTPAFLSDLRLPGEQEVLDEIGEHENALLALGERAASFERFRQLLGPLGTGDALETLVIGALNVVLEGSGYRAEDREDLRREDFWIVGPDGDFAVAEVKGQNTHIRRENVNQVDNNREALGDAAAALPGLLIINIFRAHDSLEQRQLAVPQAIVQRAANSNVLVMRTYDLFNLVARAMAGEGAGDSLVEALRADGGWLRVEPDQIEVVRQ